MMRFGWAMGRRGSVVLALVVAHVVAMMAGAFAPGVTPLLVFSSADVLQRLFVWELFTHVFAHAPSLWFAVEMLFFFWFGREVEHYVGGRTFLVVYALLVLAPALAGVVVGMGGTQVTLAGSSLATLGVFVMFAFLYPTVELLFRIQARWFAVALGALHALQAVAVRDWAGLLMLAAMLVCAFECARRIGIRSACALAARLAPSRRPPPRPVRRRVQPVGSRASAEAGRRTLEARAATVAATAEETDVDAILEKISRSGLSSLSVGERQRLESARRRLLNGEGGDERS